MNRTNDCAGIACLDCATGTSCADAAQHLDGTCCAAGDGLLHIATGSGAEVVETIANDGYVILCGGFGAAVSDIRDPSAPVDLGSAGSRCQRAAFGPVVAGVGQIFYLSHHGDSWVESPSLKTYAITDAGELAELDRLVEPGVLYEGVWWRNNVLYVAAHDGGLRVYQTDATGTPTFARTVNGFGNAWTVSAADDLLYVVDNDVGVQVMTLATPTIPETIATITTTGAPRQLDVRDNTLFVAQGGSGVEIFDVTEPRNATWLGIRRQGRAHPQSWPAAAARDKRRGRP